MKLKAIKSFSYSAEKGLINRDKGDVFYTTDFVGEILVKIGKAKVYKK